MIFSWYLLYIFKFKLLGNPWALWLFWCLHCWNDVRGRQEKSLSSRWKALWRANTFHCVLALKFAFRFVDRGQIFKFGPLSSLRAAPRLWTLANSLTKHCSSRVFFLGCAFLLGQNGHKKNVWIVDTADIVSGWGFFFREEKCHFVMQILILWCTFLVQSWLTMTKHADFFGHFDNVINQC